MRGVGVLVTMGSFSILGATSGKGGGLGLGVVEGAGVEGAGVDVVPGTGLGDGVLTAFATGLGLTASWLALALGGFLNIPPGVKLDDFLTGVAWTRRVLKGIRPVSLLAFVHLLGGCGKACAGKQCNEEKAGTRGHKFFLGYLSGLSPLTIFLRNPSSNYSGITQLVHLFERE